MRIINNAIPDHLRQAALAGFPGTGWPHWHRYKNGKLASKDALRVPPACGLALNQLAVSIHPERGFPDLDLHGAGMHLMPIGVSLGEHRDAESHPTRPWRRVGSMVYFIEDCIGGELVIGDKVISPKKNTAVMFRANQLHRVKETLSIRRTLSLFYWEVDHGSKGSVTATFTGCD